MNCLHEYISEYKLEVDEQCWCSKCAKYTRVMIVQEAEYRSKCTKCPYSRWHGQSEAHAKHAARNHRIKTAHFVRVEYASVSDGYVKVQP